MAFKCAQGSHGHTHVYDAPPHRGREDPPKTTSHDPGIEPLHQFDAGDGRSTCRNQIIHDQDICPGRHCVGMDLECRGTVFEFIVLGDRLVRQLALLAKRDPKPMSRS